VDADTSVTSAARRDGRAVEVARLERVLRVIP
jgi:hypothetical protein